MSGPSSSPSAERSATRHGQLSATWKSARPLATRLEQVLEPSPFLGFVEDALEGYADRPIGAQVHDGLLFDLYDRRRTQRARADSGSRPRTAFHRNTGAAADADLPTRACSEQPPAHSASKRRIRERRLCRANAPRSPWSPPSARRAVILGAFKRAGRRSEAPLSVNGTSPGCESAKSSTTSRF